MIILLLLNCIAVAKSYPPSLTAYTTKQLQDIYTYTRFETLD